MTGTQMRRGSIGGVWERVILFMVLLWSLLGAEERMALTVEQKHFLKQHPVIVLGAGKEWDPYVIRKEDGTVTGYDHDILSLVNRYTGAHFVLRVGDWDAMQREAEAGKIDGLSSLTRTPKREKLFLFTQSYVSIHKAIYTVPGNGVTIRSREDLAGRVIVIERGNVADEKLVASLGMRIVYAASAKECFQTLLSGKAEMTIGSDATPYLLGKFGFPHLKRVYDFTPDLPLRFALRKELFEAVEILNAGLAHIPPRVYETLQQKWFSYRGHFFDTKLTDKERAYLQKKREIGICVDPHWMPFERISRRGEYEGILADYVALFASKLHTPFVLRKTADYQESLDALRAGKCDLIVGDVATQKIKRDFLVTHPYIEISRAFVTHTDARVVYDFSQVIHAGKVGVLAASPAYAQLAKIYPGIDMVSYKSIEEGVQRVASRELVAFVGPLPSLVYSLQKMGLSNVKIAGTFPEPMKLSMLLNKSVAPLLPILNKVIDTITESERQKILSKWIQVTYVQGVDYTQLYILSAIFIVVLLLFGLYHYHTFQMKRKLERVHRELTLQMKEEIEKNRRQQLVMLHQNRLAQKGEMLNMIAHQWRQPLHTLSLVNQKLILSYRKGKMDDAEIDFFKQKSQQLIDQMSEIINDFKTFFKPEKKRVDFEVCQAVEKAVSLLDPVLKEYAIEVRFEPKHDIVCHGFPNEFGQVLVNILTNAKDAMVERKSETRRVTIRLWEEGEKIRLSICDTAGGIATELLPQVFDPYVSTKNEKNGTGLGLYMCKLIIEGHFRGHLSVENSEEGACFNIVV